MGNDVSVESGAATSSAGGDSRKLGYADLLASASQTLTGAGGMVCGSIGDALDDGSRHETNDTHASGDASYKAKGFPDKLLSRAENFCIASPGTYYPASPYYGKKEFANTQFDEEVDELSPNPMSQLFARALISEVTGNPRTMKPAAMAEREKKLLNAQKRAKTASKNGPRPVGTPGGVVGAGTGGVFGGIQNFGLGGKELDLSMNRDSTSAGQKTILPPNPLSENRAQVHKTDQDGPVPVGKHRVTIGLSLSRRHSTLGHPDTVTRQTAFDFNELQDRSYKYVSSTDSSGWRAGGGEKGGGNTPNISAHGRNSGANMPPSISCSCSDDSETEGECHNEAFATTNDPIVPSNTGVAPAAQAHKVAAPDIVHIPIIHIDCDSLAAVDAVISAMARGEVFIPHMSILPEALGVNGISPPDLVLRFGCERNDDIFPDDWPNWCLEFMHNQLYEYFAPLGAVWMKRPFQITLAKKVRWKTVKHMNNFFAHSEKVINAWREKGPQTLDPQLTYIEGGATPEEVARPHGIYLLRNGRPTNYFPPNFEPPYTTKMTRSLLSNVIDKSWDRKQRDWTSEPMPRVITPSMLISSICGCSDPNQGGFMATEATNRLTPVGSDDPYWGRNGVLNRDMQKLQQEQLTRGAKLIVPSDITRADRERRLPKAFVQQNHSTLGKIYPMTKNFSTSSKTSSHHSTGSVRSAKHEAIILTSPRLADSISNTSYVPLAFTTPTGGPSPVFERMSPVDSFGVNSQAISSPKQKESANVSEMNGAYDGMNNFAGWKDKESDAMSNTSTTSTQTMSNFFASKLPSSTANLGKDTTSDTRSKYEKIAGRSPLTISRSVIPNTSINGGSILPTSFGIKETGAASLDKFDGDVALNLPHSDYAGGISICESQTTLPVMNGGGKLIAQERERRKQRDVEREKERKKMEALELAIQEKMSRGKNVEMKETVKDKSAKGKKEKKIDKDKDREKQITTAIAAHEEKENLKKVEEQLLALPKVKTQAAAKPEITLVAAAQKSSSLSTAPSKAGLTYSSTPHKSNAQPPYSSEGLQRVNSQHSMDYSLDSTSLLGDGSLLGGQFATDGSVATVGTQGTGLISCVTRSTVHDLKNTSKQNSHSDDDVSLSILESSSSLDQVPTDEELLAVGWAKALDPNSGIYYYFTLDRSKIVWDNPLANDCVVPGRSSSSVSTRQSQ